MTTVAGAAEQLLARYRPAVDAEMRRWVTDRSLPIYGMVRYHLGWTDAEGRAVPGGNVGKGIRPALCLLSCAAVGGSPERAVPAAASLELLHNFSLVHDDIEDESPQRRHRATVWGLWGKPQAVNAGDALHIIAMLAMLGLEQRGHGPTQVLHSLRILQETCLRLCEGQYLDMEFEGRSDVTEQDYLTMIGGKSAALIAASIEIGALLGGAPPDTVAALRSGAFQLGLAFQVQDDVLGIWGDEGRMGKAASDIAQRKKSLPVVHGFQRASPGDRAMLERVFSRTEGVSEADCALVVSVLERVGARDACLALADRLYADGRQALEASGLPSESLSDLLTVADFLVHRDY